MRTGINRIIWGVLIGLFAPVVPFSIYYYLNYSFISLNGFWRLLQLAGTFVPLMSLCVIANLLAFFLFIWTKRDYAARGVLMSTFLYAFLVVILKLS